MNTSATIEVTAAHCDDERLWVGLSDGRSLSVPLTWFPRLLAGTPAQRQRVELSRRGLHWTELDEDISLAALLAGLGDQTRPAPQAVNH